MRKINGSKNGERYILLFDTFAGNFSYPAILTDTDTALFMTMLTAWILSYCILR